MAEAIRIEESAHSELSASSAKRWMNCPGSVAATRHLPNETSIYAAEGTAAHTVSEWCRRQNRKAAEFLGQKIVVGEHEFTVSQDMVDSVQTFVDYVTEFPGDAFVELRVRYDEWVPGGFGTADDVRIDGRTCYLTDFKHGKGQQVFAADNPQLKMYAIGVLQTFGWLYDIEVFRLSICQPRVDHIDVWEISALDVLAWAETAVRPAAAKAACGNAPMAAGEWCKSAFCRKRYDCAVRDNWVLEQVVGEFEDLDSALERVPADAPAEVIPDAVLPKMLGALAGIRAWCDDKEHRAVVLLQQGVDVGGWKMVEGRSQRAWSKPDDEMESVLMLAGLTAEQIYTRKMNGPAKIEKVLGKKNRILATHVTKPRGKPKLASPDDPRPAMALDVLSEFEDLDDADDE